jgi:Glycosyltransferase family 92
VVELAVATIFKNEAEYLREWLEFHMLVGAERFYLYDNGSDDGSLDVLAPYLELESVVVTSWLESPGQLGAYSHCVNTYADDAFWIAFIDIDQFFYAPDGRDLRVVLTDFDRPDVGGIAVNYADFGTSGRVAPSKRPVIESYLHRMADDGCVPLPHLRRRRLPGALGPPSYHPLSAHVSSVVRPARVRSFASPHHANYRRGTHAVTETGERTSGPLTRRVSMTRLRMNHYWTKSVAECRQKFRRGRADTGATRTWPDEFLLREAAMHVLDVTILPYAEPLREALGVDGPPVASLVAEAVERMRTWPSRLGATTLEVSGAHPA